MAWSASGSFNSKPGFSAEFGIFWKIVYRVEVYKLPDTFRVQNCEFRQFVAGH